MISIMIKPVSGSCNLQCSYCFYLDEMKHRSIPNFGRMEETVQETVVRRLLRSATEDLTIIFQGGEPTLAGLPFYQRWMELERQCNTNGITIDHLLQTNGTTLNEDWISFLKANDYLVGVSIDGPKAMHSAHRFGESSFPAFENTMEGIRLLQEGSIPWSALCVLTDLNGSDPDGLYRFFHSLHCPQVQLIPCLSPLDGNSLAPSLSSDTFGSFFCRFFDCWYPDWCNNDTFFVSNFANWIAMVQGLPPIACGFEPQCSPQYVIEADGSVYPCDFYVLEEYHLGQLSQSGFPAIKRALDESPFLHPAPLPEQCTQCPYESLCHNGCKRMRADGVYRFCEGTRAFFQHAFPRLQKLAKAQ